MKLVITSVIAIIFVALGSLAGVMLKPTVEVAASTTSEASIRRLSGRKEGRKKEIGQLR